MKNAKLIISILTLVLSLIIMLQSCAAGLGNALEGNNEIGGTAGFFLAICFIVAGIIGIVTRKGCSKGGFVAAGFYIAGGLLGFLGAGSYADLNVWSAVSVAFGILFIIFNLKMKRRMR